MFKTVHVFLGTKTREKGLIEVVAAVIYVGKKILCLQRGIGKFEYTSLKYEFPGGKIESGESPKDALRREINEELGICIRIKEKLITLSHEYPDFSINMQCYICETDEFQGNLTEHVGYVLLQQSELDKLDWIEADKLIVRLLVGKSDD